MTTEIKAVELGTENRSNYRMMRDSEKALLHVLEDRGLSVSNALVLGSGEITGKGTFFQTPYKDAHDSALKTGASLLDPESTQTFDLVAVIGTKQKQETTGLLARGFKRVKPDGLLIAALENDQGGKGLDGFFEKTGCPFDHFSKNKSRVVWTSAPCRANPVVLSEYERNAISHRRADGMWTEAGVFSYDKLDRGTELFITFCNECSGDLFQKLIGGRGADFGCGIGDLSKYVLETCPEVGSLYAIDYDRRAINCTALNLEGFHGRTETIWADIPHDPLPRELDFVVMNPPFHRGKDESVALGRKFIDRAASSLRSGGILYMVANVHLPYEEHLQERFGAFEILCSKGGFKIISARKS